jgi:hypothetical protein
MCSLSAIVLKLIVATTAGAGIVDPAPAQCHHLIDQYTDQSFTPASGVYLKLSKYA